MLPRLEEISVMGRRSVVIKHREEITQNKKEVIVKVLGQQTGLGFKGGEIQCGHGCNIDHPVVEPGVSKNE
jgi:hypothetical protein